MQFTLSESSFCGSFRFLIGEK